MSGLVSGESDLRQLLCDVSQVTSLSLFPPLQIAGNNCPHFMQVLWGLNKIMCVALSQHLACIWSTINVIPKGCWQGKVCYPFCSAPFLFKAHMATCEICSTAFCSCLSLDCKQTLHSRDHTWSDQLPLNLNCPEFNTENSAPWETPVLGKSVWCCPTPLLFIIVPYHLSTLTSI